MLFYAITYVRRPQIISFDTMAVPLDICCHNRTVAPKTPKKFVCKSVKNANFWRKYETILPRKNLPIWDPNLPLRNPKSPYLALRKYHMYGFADEKIDLEPRKQQLAVSKDSHYENINK